MLLASTAGFTSGLAPNASRLPRPLNRLQQKHRQLVASLRVRAKWGSDVVPTEVDTRRREALLAAAAVASATFLPVQQSKAVGFKKELKKRKVSPEEYVPLGDQLRVYDLSEGQGETIENGDLVVVHFDCYFRGIDVVSSRAARLLGGNRTIAEPMEIIAGGSLPKVSAKKSSFDERAGGLYAASGGPKPPPALPMAVVGMKVGGKRSVLVPAELAYGEKGQLEIPPNTGIEMQIEVLEKKSK